MQIVQASAALPGCPEVVFEVEPPAAALRAAMILASLAGVAGLFAFLSLWAVPVAGFFAAGGAALFAYDFARRRDGWFVRVSGGAVAIRLSPELAVLLEAGELVVAHQHDELWALPDAGGHMERCPFSFVELQLSHARCADLASLLRDLAPTQRFSPVSVPQSGVIRLVFRGPGWRVTPDARAALASFTAQTAAAPAEAPTRTPWREMSEEDLARHMLALYDAGDMRSAQTILAERRAEQRPRPPASRPSTKRPQPAPS